MLNLTLAAAPVHMHFSVGLQCVVWCLVGCAIRFHVCSSLKRLTTASHRECLADSLVGINTPSKPPMTFEGCNDLLR